VNALQYTYLLATLSYFMETLDNSGEGFYLFIWTYICLYKDIPSPIGDSLEQKKK